MKHRISQHLFATAIGLCLAAFNGSGAAAQSAYEEFTTPVTSYEFGPAFDVPEGKSITLITCGAIAEGCQTAAEAAAEAAEHLGWKARIIDGKLDPSVWNQAVQQAVADGSHGIITYAITPALIQGGLDAANAAGVPIIAVFQPIFEGVPEVAGYVTSDLDKSGEAGAEFLTKDSGGTGTILILDTPQFPELMKRNNSLATNLASKCPGCTVIRQDFNAALAPQRLPGQVASLVTSNTSINYISTPYDASAQFISQGLRQAGRAETVKLFAFEGNKVGLNLMRNGEIYADIATPLGFAGWLAVDLLARNLAGVAKSNYVVFPMRVFAPGDKLPEAFWEPELDYRAELKKIWQ